jgi:hypothetical protein
MKKHPLDAVSLVLGVVSLLGVAIWFNLEQGYLDTDALFWAAPGTLVLVGAAGIALSLRGTARDRQAPDPVAGAHDDEPS